eukprot:GSMAST32.ASY1.ANO1.1911.1 assembled CDS
MSSNRQYSKDKHVRNKSKLNGRKKTRVNGFSSSKSSLFSFDNSSTTNGNFSLPVRKNNSKILTSGYASAAAVKADPLAVKFESNNDADRSPRVTGKTPHTTLSILPENEDEAKKDEDAKFLNQRVIVPGMSGIDSIAFFAQNCSNTHPTKFLHLNRTDVGHKFRPYDLTVVEAKNINTLDHYTMSEEGVVHVQHGEPSEFVPLAEFMRHSTIFNVISSIKFFRLYFAAKTFRRWCENVRYNIYCAKRKKLEDKLFLANETFCVPLLDINKALVGIEDLNLIGEAKVKALHSNSFAELQEDVRASSVKQFESITEIAYAILRGVCVKAQKTHKSFEKNEQLTNLDDRAIKLMSMTQIRENAEARVTAQKRARHELSILGRYIRLIDYICIQKLLVQSIVTVERFLKHLNDKNRRSVKPYSGVTDNFGAFPIFTPTKEELSTMVKKTITEMVSMVNSVPRVVFSNPFKSHAQECMTGSAVDLQSLLRQNPRFRKAVEEIVKKVEYDFKNAQNYTSTFDVIKPVFLAKSVGIIFPDADAAKQNPLALQSITEFLSMVSTWNLELEKMKPQHVCGILYIESRELKKNLAPALEDVMLKLTDVLQEIARDQCSETLKRFSSCVGTLQMEPQTLKDFANYIEKCASSHVEANLLMKTTASLEKTYQILAHHQVKIDADASVVLDELRKVEGQYTDVTSDSEKFTNDQMSPMKLALEGQISRIVQKSEILNKRLLGGCVEDPNGEFEVVSKELDIISRAITSIQDESSNLKHYSRLMTNQEDVTEFDFSSIDTIVNNYKQRRNLWDLREKWHGLFVHAMNDTFTTDVNVDELDQKVTRIFKESYSFEKQLGNLVTIEYQGMMESFTLTDLQKCGIFAPEQLEVIERESGRASGEAQLEDALQVIVQTWAETLFTLINYRDQNNIETWYKKLNLLSDTLDEWVMCQKQWMYLETIFSAEDIQKQLPAESKKFFQTDKEFQGLMRHIQKSLEAYLETKRSAFPRFYFLSNDELLEILSQTRDPKAVQPHLCKCFDAMARLDFQNGTEMHAMVSDGAGEVVTFSDVVMAEGAYPSYEEAIERDTWLKANCFKAIKDVEAEYTVRQINFMVTMVRGNLNKNQRIMMGALTVMDVHAREVLKNMVKKDICSVTDFEWTKQLRMYWDSEIDNCNGMRLVITPLTDIIYMTLTGAVHLSFGGAPAGPAGTGKTETVKDLAKALAIQCVVFNCSDQLDFRIMGRFFSGLVQSGAWSCFDEFNRINIEVLSVIAQQIITIQHAILAEKPVFEFEGKMVKRASYAGRTELPDNLNALFRPVASEIMLFAQGFGDAFRLSNKMAQLYKLNHYDFGMRAVKSVLVAADTDENLLLIRAMRDSNLPKFLERDDLFPGIDVPYSKLANFVPLPSFIAKVIQIHETQTVRHGMMVVGQTGSGKTAAIHMLAKGLDDMYKQVDLYTLNPKSITAGELYGQFNELTGEWSDGLVPKMVRQACRDVSDGHRKWAVFDGPVDTLWIENMNTVLDDNKTLCLANSERIKLAPSLHMMFEVEDLKVASPATVSRCGMVFMEQQHIGHIPKKSMKSLSLESETHIDFLCDLMNKYADKMLDFMYEFCKMGIFDNQQKLSEMVPGSAEVENALLHIFVFAIYWSIGGNTDDKTRPKFNEFAKTELIDKLFSSGSSSFSANGSHAMQWLSWKEQTKEYVFDIATPYFDIVVPTTDTTRYRWLLNTLVCNENHALIMGLTGVATANYSAQTTPKNLVSLFESKLEKKRKTLLGPPFGKSMLFFIDDLNMPQLEEYGAQPPNELLRQKLFFKNVEGSDVTARLTPSMVTIVNAILEGFLGIVSPSLVYSSIKEALLPTPQKSHYTFNLRDLSKVFQGILMSSKEVFSTESGLLRLWCHEESRVFRDRLVDENDRGWFNKKIDTEWEISAFSKLIFGDFETAGTGQDDERRVVPYVELGNLFTEYLEEYNITFPTTMSLVFFEDAILHLARISRILRQPRGNALLVGVGGSGRKSLTRLATFVAQYKCISIEITRGYGFTEWREDIKTLLMTAGADNKQVVFLYSDTQVVMESCLEDVNNILNSGEVPNIFELDEIEMILTKVEKMCKDQDIEATTTDAKMAHFLNINNVVESLCRMAVKIHRSVETNTGKYLAEEGRYNYTTPTSYLELISLYTTKLGEASEKVTNAVSRYQLGLNKIEYAEGIVSELQKELKILQPKLAKAEKDTNELLEAAAAKEAAKVKTLKDALPAYYEAIKSLDALDKKSLQEVKSFANPPMLVGVTLEAWSEGKKLLGQMDFLQQLKNYDKDNIKKKTIKKLNKYINREDFTAKDVSNTSKAAACLCMWVLAMHTYDRVAKQIGPKREALKKAEEELEVVMNELRAKQASLKDVMDKLKELQSMFESRLGGEKGRWGEKLKILEKDLKNLIGNMMISAGCIAYIGPFTLAFHPNFDLIRILADPVEVRQWGIMGLPADNFSIMNGLFVTQGRRWPLMIDPQAQANIWVKRMFKNDLKVIKLSEANFLRTLENGIRYGSPVLLENVEEELDPGLEPGGQILLRLGDSDIPYSPEFRFFITTKLANPHYMPEICIKVTIINFTVTPIGLEDQLLVDVVRNERPDLEEKKDELVLAISACKADLQNIEDKILKLLNKINKTLASAEKTQEEISLTRETYRNVATRVDPMYQYSLQYFKALYNKRIRESEPSEILEERLSILIKDITWSMYVGVCQGLFEKDKLTYAFVMAVRIAQQLGEISDEEWKALLKGPKWLTHKMWTEMVRLGATIPAFDANGDGQIDDDDSFARSLIGENETAEFWNKYIDLCSPWNEKPEKLVFAMMEFVGVTLGKEFRTSPPFNLDIAYDSSDCKMPLIFILSRGADVMDVLLNLAKSKGKDGPDNLKIVSLGQGQGPIAESLMESGRDAGNWVCLQNYEFEGCTKIKSWKKLLFATAFYNAICLERRKFGAIGWNIPYGWMNSDFKTAVMQLKRYLEEQEKIPYETLNVYDWDKRANVNILSRYYCPDVMNDSYKFSTLQDTRNYIENLPQMELPEAYGLHQNAAITFQHKETRGITKTLVIMEGATVIGIADDPFDIRNANADTVAVIEDGSMNSMGVFLLQEVSRFNDLILVVNKSLILLKKAIKGLVVMSGELEKMFQSAYPSLKPLESWIKDFFERFYFPQGFMTAVLQTHSRKTKIAVDTLTFQMKNIGVYIHGLYMQGARFDITTMNMTESKKAELFFEMPAIQLIPTTFTEYERITIQAYRCPVYKTSVRAGTLSTTGHSTNFVVPLDIPSEVPQSHWVRRGVALLCMLDD